MRPSIPARTSSRTTRSGWYDATPILILTYSPSPHSLAHSLTHSRTHSLTPALAHSLPHSLAHSPTHPLTPFITPSLTHSPTLSFSLSLTLSRTHALTHSRTHSRTHPLSLSHSPTHPPTNSLAHSRIDDATAIFLSFHLQVTRWAILVITAVRLLRHSFWTISRTSLGAMPPLTRRVTCSPFPIEG